MHLLAMLLACAPDPGPLTASPGAPDSGEGDGDGWSVGDQDHDGQDGASVGGLDCDDHDPDVLGCTSVSGTCPGLLTLTVVGLDPAAPACVVVGSQLGPSLTHVAGDCTFSPHTRVAAPNVARAVPVDASGVAQVHLSLPAARCGSFVDVVQPQHAAPLLRLP